MMATANELLAKRIREVGESLIKNAESIAGSEEYIKSIYISCLISFNEGHLEDPEISVDKRFYPEGYIKDISGE